ncbi:hypothetical protein PRZ48_007210 [Zasmidium cellare]|uniref:Uncharacterized protein n=1 Tax=Zasmidium cellare TaxID=395010 RepID=A0ABR0EJI2_ZASCE|nr:hypothetical protein PRZ48_007210 [Zasmidium cellare]
MQSRKSLPFSILFLYPFLFCAASGQPHWTNSSSISPTRTSTTIALPGVNIRPPLSLLTGSSYTSPHTGTPEYNYFTAIESYASTTYGPAVFDHTTFQSVCPSSPRESARACYSTCTSFANACRDLHSSWSGRNADYQSSMNSKHFGGTSSRIGDSVSTNTEGLSTIWSYDTSWATSLTTVDILAQFGESQRVWPTKIYTEVEGVSTTVTLTATQEAVEVRTESQAYAAGGTGRVVSVKTLDNYLLTSTNYYEWSFSELKPPCSPTTWTECKFRTGCDKCTISGGTVRLLYFPVSRTTAEESPTTNAPVTAPRASPRTAIYGNTTLTSPSVYISFHTAYAMNACGTQIGQRYPGAILALNPNSLSSINMIWGTMYSSQAADPFASGSPYLIASSFNLADMQWPVPASAYMAQPKCQDGPFGRCSVILDDYNPLLEVPVEVRAMDPAWKSCELDWQGLYDPPTALQPAAAAATPTLPAGVDGDYTSASPQSTPTSPPVETAVPKATVQFSEPGASQESSSVRVEQDPTSAVDEAASATTALQEVGNVQSSGSSVVESSEVSAPAPTGSHVRSSSSPAIALSEAAPAVPTTHPEENQSTTNVLLDSATGPSQGSDLAASSTLQDNPSPAPQESVDVDEESGTAMNAPSSQAIVASTAPTQNSQEGVELGSDVVTGASTSAPSTAVSPTQVPQGGVAVEDTNTASSPATSSTIVDPIETARTDPAIAASEAADEDPSQTAPSLSSASSKIGTVFLDSTGEANVIFDSSTIASGQLSTPVDGPTMFIGSESGTILTRTLHSLQSTSAIAEQSAQAGETGSSETQTALQSRPLVVAIDSQTLTEGGAAQTISGKVASVASDKIVVGSQTIGIPKMQAGTQQVSLPVQSISESIGLTIFTGEGSASPTNTGDSGAKATASSADAGTALASTVPLAIFTFGTHTYTAVKTAGPSQAVVDGKTLSIGGTQVSLEGDSVSLNTDGQLEMQSNAPTTPTSGVIVASAAAITLDGTTLTAVHPSGASKGVVEVDGTTLSPGGSGLVVGDATVSALSSGIVTLGDGGNGTVALKKTTLTTGTSGSSSVSLVEPLGPSVTSGIGQVQTVGPSSSSTSGGSRISPCWRVIDALLVVMCGFAACLL